MSYAEKCPIAGRRYVYSKNRPLSSNLKVIAMIYVKYGCRSFTKEELLASISELLGKDGVTKSLQPPVLEHTGFFVFVSGFGSKRKIRLSYYSVEMLGRMTEPCGTAEDALVSRKEFEAMVKGSQ